MPFPFGRRPTSPKIPKQKRGKNRISYKIGNRVKASPRSSESSSPPQPSKSTIPATMDWTLLPSCAPSNFVPFEESVDIFGQAKSRSMKKRHNFNVSKSQATRTSVGKKANTNTSRGSSQKKRKRQRQQRRRYPADDCHGDDSDEADFTNKSQVGTPRRYNYNVTLEDYARPVLPLRPMVAEPKSFNLKDNGYVSEAVEEESSEIDYKEHSHLPEPMIIEDLGPAASTDPNAGQQESQQQIPKLGKNQHPDFPRHCRWDLGLVYDNGPTVDVAGKWSHLPYSGQCITTPEVTEMLEEKARSMRPAALHLQKISKALNFADGFLRKDHPLFRIHAGYEEILNDVKRSSQPSYYSLFKAIEGYPGIGGLMNMDTIEPCSPRARCLLDRMMEEDSIKTTVSGTKRK